jgi:hypothetical protein
MTEENGPADGNGEFVDNGNCNGEQVVNHLV